MCSLAIQHILAPPPPPVDPDVSFDMEPASESSKHFIGTLLCMELVEACCKVQGNAAQSDVSATCEVLARCCRLLSLIFVHGETVGKELFSAITIGHLYSGVDVAARWSSHKIGGEALQAAPSSSASFCPVSAASHDSALTQAAVPDVLVALLSLLSVAVSGCTQAAQQLLRDPSNLFVVDLASEASELAGVAPVVRISSCLFLSACCNAFPPAGGTTPSDDDALDRNSFLGIINARFFCTLKRFSEILRSPLDFGGLGEFPAALLLFGGFPDLFKAEVKQVMKAIYQFYNDNGDSTGARGKRKEKTARGLMTSPQRRRKLTAM